MENFSENFENEEAMMKAAQEAARKEAFDDAHVNESFENIHSDIYGADTASQARFVVNNANDTSILSAYNSNSSTIHNYAKEMPIIVKTIDRSRYCSFRQKFPSTYIAHKKIQVGKSSATQYRMTEDISDLSLIHI